MDGAVENRFLTVLRFYVKMGFFSRVGVCNQYSDGFLNIRIVRFNVKSHALIIGQNAVLLRKIQSFIGGLIYIFGSS